MPFNPMSWHDGKQFKTVFVVRELVVNSEILLLTNTKKYGVVLRLLTVSKESLSDLRSLDFGGAQERKMKASLRRISRKKGTTKKARAAVKEVLS